MVIIMERVVNFPVPVVIVCTVRQMLHVLPQVKDLQASGTILYLPVQVGGL